MFEEKRGRICLINAGNAVNPTSWRMGKFSNPPAGGRNSTLFNLCNGFCKVLLYTKNPVIKRGHEHEIMIFWIFSFHDSYPESLWLNMVTRFPDLRLNRVFPPSHPPIGGQWLRGNS